MADWPTLNLFERRVLGVLVEKQKTTDTYPLTPNALETGCNQKSNRDPILELDEVQIDDAMTALQKRGLVSRVVSGRVDKWKHLLYENWNVNGVELAILAELLLRGPQTEGELRARASRMDDIADVEALRALLKPLVERRMVVYLTPEGRRGTMLTHGFHEPQELDRIKNRFANAASEPDAPPPSPSYGPPPTAAKVDLSPLESRLNEAHTRIADMNSRIDALSAEVARLHMALQHVQKELGIAVPGS